jgi:hypothetical protein
MTMNFIVDCESGVEALVCANSLARAQADWDELVDRYDAEPGTARYPRPGDPVTYVVRSSAQLRVQLSETVSKIFREAFLSHPARESDPGLAITSAREDACEAVPAGVTGVFDDESLTFNVTDDRR